MLLRGQILVGYRHYGDDVLREFVRLSVKNGIDIFRVFDSLNDLRNMEMAIRIVKQHGAHVVAAIAAASHVVQSYSHLQKAADPE